MLLKKRKTVHLSCYSKLQRRQRIRIRSGNMMCEILVEDGAVGKSHVFSLWRTVTGENSVGRKSVGLKVDDSLHFTCIH